MAYHVVEASSARDLEKTVNALIAEGWVPSGGLSVATYAAGSWWYYQAMVRRADA